MLYHHAMTGTTNCGCLKLLIIHISTDLLLHYIIAFAILLKPCTVCKSTLNYHNKKYCDDYLAETIRLFEIFSKTPLFSVSSSFCLSAH